MDRTDDNFKIVRDKAVQFEREEKDEDDVERNHVSRCTRGHGFTNVCACGNIDEEGQRSEHSRYPTTIR